MKDVFHLRLFLYGILLVAAIFLSGCVIFSPAGRAISQGYENTIAYFNAYYNASRLFGEAEDEILADARFKRGKDAAIRNSREIPGSAKQKFTQVIDKCSNILAYHPNSNLVDDAILLIGKSFFYQYEYLKAERKFEELLTQFPNSSLVPETQIWLVRTEEKLGKVQEGIAIDTAAVSAARISGERELEMRGRYLLGLFYIKTRDTVEAAQEFEQVLEHSHDEDLRSDALIGMGDMYAAGGQDARAVETYLRIPEYTSDVYARYYCRLQAAILEREMNEPEKSLALVNSLSDDFRNREYLPSIRYERANDYAALGRDSLAVDEYAFVDTTYVRSEYAAQAAYQLGQIYEQYYGSYRLALKYYTEVNTPAAAAVAPEGRRKYGALTRYFDAQKKLRLADSLQTILDDTSRTAGADSLAVRRDTVRRNAKPETAASAVDTAHRHAGAAPHLPPNPDSIRATRALAAQDLGDVFYTELPIADSAYYWYTRALELSADSIRHARMIFVLAEISRANPDKKFPPARVYYARLKQYYPESPYTDEVRRIESGSTTTVAVDPAKEEYERAESAIDGERYGPAIDSLRAIARTYPHSRYAAKSEYAVAWLLENKLTLPDSAVGQYRRVTKQYPGTVYAAAAARRFSDVPDAGTTRKDTAAPAADSLRVRPVNPSGVRKDTSMTTPGQPRKDLPDIDEMKQRRRRPPTMPDSLKQEFER